MPKRKNRADVLRFVSLHALFRLLLTWWSYSQPPPKKAPARKKAAAGSSTQKQSQLNFQPAGKSSRAAATKARGRMVVSYLVLLIKKECTFIWCADWR